MRELIILIFIVVYIVSSYLKNKPKAPRITKESYKGPVTNTDKGSYGEQLVIKNLAKLDGYKRFLRNCYVPKPNGDKVEIDVIMLHESGIYVFESKNFSGWIFGNEKDKYWMQTIPSKYGAVKKSQFFNPIIQNQNHINWLKEFLGKDLPYFSYIVFGDDCTLKNVTVKSAIHRVVKSKDIYWCVMNNSFAYGTKLRSDQIDNLYHRLYPLTQLSQEEKERHIKKIREKYNLKWDDLTYIPGISDLPDSLPAMQSYTYVNDNPYKLDNIVVKDLSQFCDNDFFSDDPEFSQYVEVVEIKKTVQDD